MCSYSEQNDGYAWILSIVDTDTKFVMVGVLKTQSWRELAKLFEQFGSPRLLHTNNGTELKNETVTGLCARYGTRQIHGRCLGGVKGVVLIADRGRVYFSKTPVTLPY
ncbi:MAG: uncharacterized protein A8A55_2660 [Amphiamblys sp. WSBS2006]|nr:MAG: uncharacterized protein A8A55_2660 [Amphiamblys sp. WSBS2006]